MRFFQVTLIFFLYMVAISDEQLYIYDGNLMRSSEGNTTLHIQVSTVNISLICQLDNFIQWEKNGQQLSLDRRLHFPFFSLNQGGVYFCKENTSYSLFIDLIPTGSGVFQYSKESEFYHMLNNLTEIVGPFESDSIISCAGSSNLSSSQFNWYSSGDFFSDPLPISQLTYSPIIPKISAYPSANDTLLNIHLGYFFQSLDNEGIYLCVASNQNNKIAMYFVTIYSKPPVYLVIADDFGNVTIKRDILYGSVPIDSVTLGSNLYFDCQATFPEILLPTKKVLHSFIRLNFSYSDIGLYECRSTLDDTVSIKVDIIIKVRIRLFSLQQPVTPLCEVTLGSCILPIATRNLSIQCLTSSNSLQWDIPSNSPVASDLTNNVLQVFLLDFFSSGLYSCQDLIYNTQAPGKVNILSSGIFLEFTDDHHSTQLFADETVVIYTPFTLSCFIGSIETFTHFDFFFIPQSSDNYAIVRNETSHSLHLKFSQFDIDNNGFYTCGGYLAIGQNITVKLISFRFVPSNYGLNISIVHIGPNFISLMWDDISDNENNGNILEFILRYRINNTLPYLQIPGIKGLSYTLTSLMSSSVYEISISARNSFGIGPPSPSLFVNTFVQDSSPIGVTFLFITSHSFIISWQENPILVQNVERYSFIISGEKQYFTSTSIPQQTISVPFSQTTATVNNLVADTNYSVIIVANYVLGNEESIKYYVQTLEGDLSVSSPQTTLIESTNSNEIFISLTNTNNVNAEILFHLLIVFIIEENYNDFGVDLISLAGISEFQSPYSVDSYYVYILLNISSSCSFPTSITTSFSLDTCLSQNGKYTNPQSMNGYFYKFILRAVTRNMNIFDSSPSAKLLVPISSHTPIFQSNIIYATISALLIILLLVLCAILVFIALLLSSNHHLKRNRSNFSHDNFSFSQDIEHQPSSSAKVENSDMPPALVCPTTSPLLLFSRLGSDIDIKLPNFFGSNPISYVWMKDNEIVEDDDYITITSDFDILIRDTQRIHAGIYVCSATNFYGKIEYPITLVINGAVQTTELFLNEDENVTSTFIQVGNTSNDIPLSNYGDFLKTMHYKNNQGFKREYILGIDMNYVSIALVRPGITFSTCLFQGLASSGIENPLNARNQLFTLDIYAKGLANTKFFTFNNFQELIEHIPGTSNSVAKDFNNRTKNRYSNIYSYNHSRVILLPIPDYEEYSQDYINASFIDGFSQPSQYISSQGPLNNTIGDFWRLVWQQKIQVIVMLTNLREGEKIKCSCYWPDVNNCLDLGPFNIHNISMVKHLCYIRRNFEIENLSEIGIKRNVSHFQFIAWPDFGVPEISSLLDFHRIVITEYDLLPSSKGPPLVHCSAGVGRSGTFIVIDNMLKKLQVDSSLNIHSFVNKMRRNRSKMIQTLEQYIFCHDALLVAAICRKPIFNYTLVVRKDIHDFIDMLQREDDHYSSPADFEFQALSCISLQPQDVPCHFAKSNLDKNRNPIYLPPDYSTVSLTSTRGYINAAFVDSYHHKHAFIIAQTPIPATVADFWRLVADYEISTIVMLYSEEQSHKDDFYQYWPDIGITHQFSDSLVSLVSTEDTQFGCHRSIILSKSQMPGNTSENVLEIDHYCYTDWLDDDTPCNYADFASFVFGMSHKCKHGQKDTVLVHCSDSVQKSAIFVASSYSFERLTNNDTIDVFQTAKYLRYCKPGSFQRQSQYLAIYRTVQALIRSTEFS